MSERSKLIWRCRRGMKELDVLLLAYLERHYDGASAAERQAFHHLLELQDPQLYAYLIGREIPTDEVVRRVVECIRAGLQP
ncbi:MAG TPA: succinate dehydrogenase assembly factor 2 [Candidatus Competibacteraceae bacterium]|nr:succinate dehydrogenase assembly factor 2 [Candidatus Competibacteraceae bacterium]